MPPKKPAPPATASGRAAARRARAKGASATAAAKVGRAFDRSKRKAT